MPNSNYPTYPTMPSPEYRKQKLEECHKFYIDKQTKWIKRYLKTKEKARKKSPFEPIIGYTGDEVFLDKNYRLIPYFTDSSDYHLGLYGKTIIEMNDILEKSPFRNYAPHILYPNTNMQGFRGYHNSNLYALSLKNLFLKDPPKGKIGGWTKKEKAYFESLQTKRERYIHLVARSGLRSSTIDFPLDAIANPKKYPDIFAQVEKGRARYRMHEYPVRYEWELTGALLGDMEGFCRPNVGFSSRNYAACVLACQLGAVFRNNYYSVADRHTIPNLALRYFAHTYPGGNKIGSFPHFCPTKKDKLRETQIINIANTFVRDKFGMMPYFDEIVGLDWVWDWNRTNYLPDEGSGIKYTIDVSGIREGKFLHPCDEQATKETRDAIRDISEKAIAELRIPLHYGAPRYDERQAKFNCEVTHQCAKTIALHPPQGYPNAPLYYFPEEIEEDFEQGRLDINLDPRIPAIYRIGFDQNILDRIEEYAKKHKIYDDEIDYGAK